MIRAVKHKNLDRKVRTIVTFGVLVLGLPGLPAQEEKLAEPTIELLLRDLGEGNFKTREKAHAEIWSRGVDALAELKGALKSDNPELRYRAKELTDFISIGIFPDSDARVITLVKQIRKMKVAIGLPALANELIDLEAYRPLIFLYEKAPSGVVKEGLKIYANSALKIFSEELFKQEKFEEAEALAKILENTEGGAKVLVSLYAYQGRLEAQADLLEKAGEGNSLLMLYIRARQSRWKDAKQIAEVRSLQGVSEKFSLLMGDPDPAIQLFRENKRIRGVPAGVGAKDLSYALADAIDQGKFETLDEFIKPLSEISSGTTNGNLLISKNTALLTNGWSQTLEEDLENLYIGFEGNEELFEIVVGGYVSVADSPIPLLRAMGAPTDTSKLVAWGLKAVETYQSKELAFQTEPELRKIRHLVKLLNRRGEKQMIRDVLSPLFDGLNKDLIEGNKADSLTAKLALHKWAGELIRNQMGWYLVERLPGNSKDVLEALWLQLSKIIGESAGGREASHEIELIMSLLKDKRIDATEIENVLLLSGYYKSVDHEKVEELKATVKKAIEKLPKDQQDEYKSASYVLAGMRGDVIQVLEYLETHANGKSYDGLTRELLAIYLSTGEWAKVDKMIAKFAEEGELQLHYYVQWSIALHHLGKTTEAKAKLAKFDLLSMGDGAKLENAARELSSHQMNDESKRYYESVLAFNDISKEDYHHLITELNFNYPLYFGAGDWKMAYAIAKLNKYTNIFHLSTEGSNLARSLAISNQADTAKGLLLFDSNPELANRYFTRAVKTSSGGGRLADYYFPLLEKIGAGKAHKLGFKHIEEEFEELLKHFPECENTLNSYAWTAAKAGYKLDKAEKNSRKSLRTAPYNFAYIDTLAEIFFARGEREKAVKISKRAVKATLLGYQGRSSVWGGLENYKALVTQLRHFENDPFPNHK